PVVVLRCDPELALEMRRSHHCRIVDRRLVAPLGLCVALGIRVAPSLDALYLFRGVVRVPTLALSKVAFLALVAMAVAHALHPVERVERLGLVADATAL